MRTLASHSQPPSKWLKRNAIKGGKNMAKFQKIKKFTHNLKFTTVMLCILTIIYLFTPFFLLQKYFNNQCFFKPLAKHCTGLGHS